MVLHIIPLKNKGITYEIIHFLALKQIKFPSLTHSQLNFSFFFLPNLILLSFLALLLVLRVMVSKWKVK